MTFFYRLHVVNKDTMTPTYGLIYTTTIYMRIKLSYVIFESEITNVVILFAIDQWIHLLKNK